MTSFSVKQGFEEHSKHYGLRVSDRDTYPYLDVTDKLIVDFLVQNWPENYTGTLLDAACGTGDRLKILFDRQHFPRKFFHRIEGSDYSEGMLKIAKMQTVKGEPLYDGLHVQDLVNTKAPSPVADLVLCLWHVTNSVGLASTRLLKNLAQSVNDGGYLIYDTLMTADLPLISREKDLLSRRRDLMKDPDPQKVWYEREDRSVSCLRMTSPSELMRMLNSTGLQTVALWGFVYENPIPCQLIKNDAINTTQLDEFPGVIAIQQKRAP